jgi:phosphatidylglycerol:prolipoprotein diacylglycerol transferase
MIPVIWKIPGLGFEIPGYGLALMIGFLASIWWAARRAERSGANPDVILNCGFLALFGGVIGSRAMYVWHYWDQFAQRGSLARLLWAIVDVRKGGLEVYGGFILVVVLVLLYLWRYHHSIRWYLDIVAPSAALGMAIGRIGCFLNGCCYGGVCDLPWAVRFPYGSGAAHQQWADREPGAGLPQELLIFSSKGMFADGSAAYPIPRESLRASDRELAAAEQAAKQALEKATGLQAQAEQTSDAGRKQHLLAQAQSAELGAAQYFDIRALMKRYHLSAADLRALARKHPSLPVHPTELYSTITLGLLAALLSTVYWRRTRDGQVVCTMLLVEPWTRWLLEIVRADNPVDTLGGFTISQFLAICLSAAGLIGLLALRSLPPRSPRAVWWEPPVPLPQASATGKKSPAPHAAGSKRRRK